MTRRDYSREDISYALSLVRLGYTPDHVRRALTAKPSGRRDPGSVKYMRLLESRGKDTADAYMTRTVDKAFSYAAENAAIKDRNDAILRLLELEAAANALPWAIYAGAGVRRTLEAAFAVGDRTGGVRFGLALRAWAETAGQSFETIRTNRDMLVRLGWLRRNPNDRPGRTGRYTISRPSHIQHTGIENVGDATTRTWLAHDAFRPDALGDYGWYVLATLRGETDLGRLSAVTGFGDDGLMDIATRLRTFGLVEITDTTIMPGTEMLTRLEDAARKLGTLGDADRDHADFAEDRKGWRERRDSLVNVGAPS